LTRGGFRAAILGHRSTLGSTGALRRCVSKSRRPLRKSACPREFRGGGARDQASKQMHTSWLAGRIGAMIAEQPLQWFSLILGAWLFLSRFVWTHSAAQFANACIVAVLYTSLATAALGNPRVRYANVIIAAWLFLSAWLLPRAQDATLWHNVALSIAMIGVAIAQPRVITRGPQARSAGTPASAESGQLGRFDS
jgi:hypothetical protein